MNRLEFTFLLPADFTYAECRDSGGVIARIGKRTTTIQLSDRD